ncbi:RNA polymerase II transcriptional coactivator KELP [Cinnamomum micranthum f. kanehirae]|uniref:RNA polymerase II transcriptional coactivator KELP n=1 Tax=Cinnamomum micranthum f. kanehirae TaxID=337451 RepID=A0A3S3NL38_9MAGN|nr:RNA polymerase II transcriptional coactivator KELP [Cinnamomum micranthum f. kanehirae]
MEPETETETQAKIKETVVEILKSSDMDEMTESKLRNMASEKLGIDLSLPQYKTLVRGVVQPFISSIKEDKETKEEAAQEEEEQQHSKKKGERERDDDGELTICRLTNKRRVTIHQFKGKTYVSIREFYENNGKQMPSRKGISLTTDQWAELKKSVPAIEAAIKKMESRLN